MEFEDVDGQFRWEAKRVAVAFEVQRCIIHDHTESWSLWNWLDIEGFAGAESCECSLHKQTLDITRLSIGDGEDDCAVYRASMWSQDSPFFVRPANTPIFNELISRVFYRLGLEDEDVLSQLPRLSAHEKLELRLSIPREFWPKKWLDEER